MRGRVLVAFYRIHDIKSEAMPSCPPMYQEHGYLPVFVYVDIAIAGSWSVSSLDVCTDDSYYYTRGFQGIQRIYWVYERI